MLKEKARESLHAFFSKLIAEDTVVSDFSHTLECGGVSGVLRKDAIAPLLNRTTSVMMAFPLS